MKCLVQVIQYACLNEGNQEEICIVGVGKRESQGYHLKLKIKAKLHNADYWRSWTDTNGNLISENNSIRINHEVTELTYFIMLS